jgi:addiction module RelE/StbE family toxin
MAKQVIWSPRSKRELNEILEYWIQRNKSNSYSKKLTKLFKKAAQLISEHPNMGKLTNDKTARFKVVRDYLMIYEELDNKINVLTIWDGRQDPDKLKVR